MFLVCGADQSKHRTAINKHFGGVELPSHAKLRDCVVERVFVVPVVPALANGSERDLYEGERDTDRAQKQ